MTLLFKKHASNEDWTHDLWFTRPTLCHWAIEATTIQFAPFFLLRKSSVTWRSPLACPARSLHLWQSIGKYCGKRQPSKSILANVSHQKYFSYGFGFQLPNRWHCNAIFLLWLHLQCMWIHLRYPITLQMKKFPPAEIIMKHMVEIHINVESNVG